MADTMTKDIEEEKGKICGAQAHTLCTQNLFAGYADKKVLQDVNVQIPQGQVSVILGSNGCGKSTLLKSFARLLKPREGEVLLDDRNIFSIPDKEMARQLGLLPQIPVAPEGITVADLVARGRFPHRKFMQGMSKKDYEAVARALKMLQIEDLADRPVDALSGGQRQRVWIAMALAQETDILLLDEPTTYLDISHQLEILDILQELNETYGTTIVMVLHDINLAARYADHIFAMKQGRLEAEGKPDEVITPQIMKSIYNLDCQIMKDPITGTPMVLPLSRRYRHD